MGIEIPKATIHGLIEKSANLLDRLIPTLKDAIIDQTYIHFDETYHTILGGEKKSRKGYFWSDLAHNNNLIQFIYENGSRSKNVFTNYLPQSYKGAVQTDGYSSYKVLEGWDYKNALRLGCIQHCKRKFIEIEEQPRASEIIGMATLYSLAISCRLNRINTFEYFCDVINRLAQEQSMEENIMRELLPDRWIKTS